MVEIVGVFGIYFFFQDFAPEGVVARAIKERHFSIEGSNQYDRPRIAAKPEWLKSFRDSWTVLIGSK
jgi:hypothetical protein